MSTEATMNAALEQAATEGLMKRRGQKYRLTPIGCGYAACLIGESTDANPHRKNSRPYREWNEGFARAGMAARHGSGAGLFAALKSKDRGEPTR